jgi:glycosyltransferase involved in cell wall biosynthesis
VTAAPKYRVLHIITRLIVGGAQENTLLSVEGLDRMPEFEVTLATGVDRGPEGDLLDRARRTTRLVIVPELGRAISPIADLIAFVKLYRLIRRGRYDIVHTHSSKAGVLGRIAAWLAGTPIIVHTLHSLVFHEYQSAWKNRLYIALKRRCAPLTDAFISVNAKTQEGALAAGIGSPDRHQVIYSGMELEPFLGIAGRLPASEAKRRLGIPPQARVVGKIARLTPLKGHAQLLDAAAVIARGAPDAWFLLVGNGILREELEARAVALGIRARTVFAGLVPPAEVPAHIQAMDVVVHSSLREGIARVIPQAGAVGKPVVTFALDGAPEVIRDGVSGFLVPPGDTGALGERVLELLGDPGRCEAFGAAGREFAAANFSADQMVERIGGVYERLIAEKLGAVRRGR